MCFSGCGGRAAWLPTGCILRAHGKAVYTVCINVFQCISMYFNVFQVRVDRWTVDCNGALPRLGWLSVRLAAPSFSFLQVVYDR